MDIDVSGTDSPFRETSNISDGSCFTADMAVQVNKKLSFFFFGDNIMIELHIYVCIYIYRMLLEMRAVVQVG